VISICAFSGQICPNNFLFYLSRVLDFFEGDTQELNVCFPRYPQDNQSAIGFSKKPGKDLRE
jgi:hypothetical protein